MTAPRGSDGRQRPAKRVLAASVIGSVIEWYDFTIYGLAAALVFGGLFFPGAEPVVGTLASFATYAVGFAARPVGAIIFGHVGDRVGRKPALVMTLLLMGIATALIGALPTYATLGLAAPILLVALRLVQGLGAGAEYAGAVLYTAEHSPPHRRGLYASWPVGGVWIGIAIASLVFLVVAKLPEEALTAWGWRVPFLLSIVAVGLGLFIRLRLEESPAFSEIQRTQAQLRVPLAHLLRTQPRELLVAVGGQVGVGYLWVLLIFSLSYITQGLGLSIDTALIGATISSLAAFATTLAFGALSDRLGRRPVFLGGAAFGVLFAFPFFVLMETRVPVLVWAAMTVGLAGGMAGMVGPQAALYAELFGTRHRFSGFAFAREVSSAVAVGPAPLIATALLRALDGEPWLVATYMLISAAIPFMAVYWAEETKDRDLVDAAPAPSSTAEPGAARYTEVSPS